MRKTFWAASTFVLTLPTAFAQLPAQQRPAAGTAQTATAQPATAQPATARPRLLQCGSEASGFFLDVRPGHIDGWTLRYRMPNNRWIQGPAEGGKVSASSTGSGSSAKCEITVENSRGEKIVLEYPRGNANALREIKVKNVNQSLTVPSNTTCQGSDFSGSDLANCRLPNRPTTRVQAINCLREGPGANGRRERIEVTMSAHPTEPRLEADISLTPRPGRADETAQPRALLVTSAAQGNTCLIEVRQAHQDDNNNFRMTLRFPHGERHSRDKMINGEIRAWEYQAASGEVMGLEMDTKTVDQGGDRTKQPRAVNCEVTPAFWQRLTTNPPCTFASIVDVDSLTGVASGQQPRLDRGAPADGTGRGGVRPSDDPLLRPPPTGAQRPTGTLPFQPGGVTRPADSR